VEAGPAGRPAPKRTASVRTDGVPPTIEKRMDYGVTKRPGEDSSSEEETDGDEEEEREDDSDDSGGEDPRRL